MTTTQEHPLNTPLMGRELGVKNREIKLLQNQLMATPNLKATASLIESVISFIKGSSLKSGGLCFTTISERKICCGIIRSAKRARIYYIFFEHRCVSLRYRNYSEHRVPRDEVPRMGSRSRSRRVLLGRERQVQRVVSRCHPGLLRTRSTGLRGDWSVKILSFTMYCIHDSNCQSCCFVSNSKLLVQRMSPVDLKFYCSLQQVA
jgi:hypothetical protein